MLLTELHQANTQQQYQALVSLAKYLQKHYPAINKQRITGIVTSLQSENRPCSWILLTTFNLPIFVIGHVVVQFYFVVYFLYHND